MAEGLAKHFLGHQYDIFSAGSRPAEKVHTMASAVMAEIGIDISMQKPKSISDINLDKIDTVISLCAEEDCPVLPKNVQHISWALPDPARDDDETNTQIRRFRKIRDEIKHKVLGLRAQDQTW
jgi:arsenate reductase (thioredoxin)